ncbi:MAG: phosphoglycerate kinase [Candidatus Peregrinibacteria bacterium Gr01-1014_25]|nr:MAG: phosphoglycerate kinase [Candidatus Peregrinibacteria bacterium Gr01-1014_25]
MPTTKTPPTSFPYRTLDQAQLGGKRVLLRAGFDVPVEGGVVTDTSRIEAILPTMRFILDHGASLVIMAHQGRPKDAPDPAFSQKPLVPVLEKLLKATVHFAPSCTGSDAVSLSGKLQPGDVLLLENLRFDPREKKNDPSLARDLASLADIYVNDAFTNCHRKHASMVGVPALLPSFMGLQLEREVRHLAPILGDPRRPTTLIISGAKMETKIPVIRNFLDRGDDILLGGCIANTFLAARGFDVGASRYEPDFVEQCRELMLEAEKPEKADIHVPRDAVVASAPSSDSIAMDLPLEDIEGDMQILDIGTVSAERYEAIIRKSGTIVWNGPLGLFEVPHFANASKRIAAAVADATRGGATSVVGGGDTLDFHVRYGLPLEAYTFASTAGGAMLEFLAGERFIALEALKA